MDTAKELPTKPSELIRLALADLRACERDDRYVVDMGDWHRPSMDDREVCRVCLAGAVLAQTLGLPREHAISTEDLAGYGSSVQGALLALDFFRRGEIANGLDWLHHDQSEEWEEWDKYAWGAEYDKSNPDEFHECMHRRADYLASYGL